MNPYWSVLIFAGISFVLSVVPFLVNWLAAPRTKPNSASLLPYECGFDSFESARLPFDIRYYIITIVFILFDLEIMFLFPWAITLKETGYIGLVSMLVFLGEFVIIFGYLWKQGILDWD